MKIKTKHLLSCLAIAVLVLSWTPKIEAFTIRGTQTDNAGGEILSGYVPSSYKKETGYSIEHFGFIGGHFSKVVVEYDTFPCCKPTGNEMDGCSAPEICPMNL